MKDNITFRSDAPRTRRAVTIFGSARLVIWSVMFRYAFVLLLFALAGPTATGQITYNVLPVTLSNGYEITGGTIQTDGTLGLLSSLMDYEIVVTGPLGYTFDPSNPSSNVALVNVISTATELYIPAAPAVATDRLVLSALDDFDVNCSACVQNVNWLQDGLFSRRGYSHYDLADDFPNESGLALTTPQEDRLVIARVPEPGSFGICLSAGLAAVCFRLRRKHKA